MVTTLINSLFRERSEKDKFPAPKETSRQEIIKSLEEIKQSVSNLFLFVYDLQLYLGDRCDHFRAGCVAHSIANWQNITSDTEILTTSRVTDTSLVPVNTSGLDIYVCFFTLLTVPKSPSTPYTHPPLHKGSQKYK